MKTSLINYIDNAATNTIDPAEYAVEMAIIKIIRSAEARYETLNEAYLTTSNDAFYGQKGFRLAEMRMDSDLIADRNRAAVYACRVIVALNTEVRLFSGESFLRRKYDLNIRINQRDITELECCMADFDDCFDEAISFFKKRAA